MYTSGSVTYTNYFAESLKVAAEALAGGVHLHPFVGAEPFLLRLHWADDVALVVQVVHLTTDGPLARLAWVQGVVTFLAAQLAQSSKDLLHEGPRVRQCSRVTVPLCLDDVLDHPCRTT